MTYIFDFDGTLVDSMPVFGKVMIELLEKNNIAYPDDVIKIVTPLGYRGTAEYVISLGLRTTVDEFIEGAIERMAFEYHTRIPAKEHVTEKLLELREKGYSLNVLTASPHAILDKCLVRLGLFELFDNVWSCDDFKTTKADPEIYRRVAEKLGVSVSECRFVDDNVGSVSTAKKAGMFAIGVFDESSRDFMDEMKKASDKYIMDFRELD